MPVCPRCGTLYLDGESDRCEEHQLRESKSENLAARSRRRRVYLVMGAICVLVPLVDELLEGGNLFQPLPWPFLLFGVAGAWASYVSSLEWGMLAGATMGFVMTAMRGFVMPLFGLPVPAEEQVMVGFYMVVAVVVGLLLGTVGAMVGLAFRKWRGRAHSS